MMQERSIFDESHNLFRDTVRRFFKEEAEPHLKEWEKQGMFDPGIFRKAAELGILCAGIPEEYGGGGGDFLHHAILHEEIGYSIAGASMGGSLGIDGSSYIIFAGGTEEQKKSGCPVMPQATVSPRPVLPSRSPAVMFRVSVPVQKKTVTIT